MSSLLTFTAFAFPLHRGIQTFALLHYPFTRPCMLWLSSVLDSASASGLPNTSSKTLVSRRVMGSAEGLFFPLTWTIWTSSWLSRASVFVQTTSGFSYQLLRGTEPQLQEQDSGEEEYFHSCLDTLCGVEYLIISEVFFVLFRSIN